MGGKDSNYQVVLRGETLERFVPGGYVFIQRAKVYGGGFWLIKTYNNPWCSWFVLERPVSLNEGLNYLIVSEAVEAKSHLFDDDFTLTG